MKFTSLVPRREIGANSYLLELGETRIVLDAGMHPKGLGLEALPRLSDLEYDSVDAVVVTHSHLDHIGAVPVLMRAQPSAQLLMTEATQKITETMWHNSVNVMCMKREETGISDYPFYTHREVDQLMRRLPPVHVGRSFHVAEGEVRAEFYNAGHVLGAIGVRFEHEGQNIFYTGDVHFESQTVVAPASFPESGIDTLIMETTRGAHPRVEGYTRAAEIQRLGAAIRETYERGGAVLIPVFALGKTQEMLLILHELKAAGEIPSMPVFIGGLSTKVTGIFDKLADKAHRNYPGLRILEEVDIEIAARKHRKQIQFNPRCIYALSSGMLTENTVSHGFAPRIMSDPASSILFVGYTDPESPGGKINAAAKGDLVEISEGKEPVELCCEVEQFDFSGHSTREDILDYAVRLAPKRIILVHGDEPALEWFEAELAKKLPDCEIHAPGPGDHVPLH